MYCAECGAQLPATANFCLQCGHKREATVASVDQLVTSPLLTDDGRPVDSTRDVWERPVVADTPLGRAKPSTAQRPLPRAVRAEPFFALDNRARSTREEVSTSPAILALAAAALVVVGSLGPWVSITAPFVGSMSVSGTDGDGKITACCGVAAIVLLAFLVTSHRSSAWLGVAAALALGIAAVAGIYDWQNLSDAVDTGGDVPVLASVGWGLQAMTVGAIVGAGLSVVQAAKALAAA